jgi:hypothetical protein
MAATPRFEWAKAKHPDCDNSRFGYQARSFGKITARRSRKRKHHGRSRPAIPIVLRPQARQRDLVLWTNGKFTASFGHA